MLAQNISNNLEKFYPEEKEPQVPFFLIANVHEMNLINQSKIMEYVDELLES